MKHHATLRMIWAVGLGLLLLPPAASGQNLIEPKLIASTGAAADRFGAALAVSGDVLVATAPNTTVDDKRFAGAAYVFVRDARTGEWVEQKRLVPDDSAALDFFGNEVAIDGDTVFVGAAVAKVGSVTQQGAVYIFERNSGGADNWGQVAKLSEGGMAANFGSSIAIKDGLLAIGASRSGTNGAVTIYDRDRGGAGAWGKVTTIADSAVGDAGTPLESFGQAVAIDGDLLLVGASAADVSYFGENDGAAYIFRRDPVDRDLWNFVARLTASEATLCAGGRTLAEISLESLEVRLEVERCAKEVSKTDQDAFGGNVAIRGDVIVVSAAGAEDPTGPVVGAVYIFRQGSADADHWDQIAKLAASDLLAGSFPGFGGGMALADDTLLVGAASAVGPKGAQGAAYLFERNAGGPDAWGETSKLVAGDGLAGELFGSSVAFDGEEAIVGASGYDIAQGAIYVAPEKPPEPAFAPTGDLVDGGLVEGPGGAVLGSALGTITEPLPVWIVEVPPPAEPLDASTHAISAFYNIGSSRTTTAADSGIFGLALPVPAGADSAHLAAAILVPASSMLDGPEWGEFWIPEVGVYDPASDLFTIALDDLALEGSIVVLIEDPDLEPLPLLPISALRETEDATFDVSCRGFEELGVCGSNEEEKFEGFLEEANASFTALGYANPALRNKTVHFEKPDQFTKGVTTTYYGNYIEPLDSKRCLDGSKVQAAGVYVRKGITFCLSQNALEIDNKTTARHELFHAFQSGFSEVGQRTAEDEIWIIEGTAAAAENSDAAMERDTLHPLHPVDRGLTAVLKNPKQEPFFVDPYSDQYTPQDFWVYFGTKNNLGLDYLRLLFERGSGTEAAADFFLDAHQSSLGDQYWSWVKNQAIEKTIDSPFRMEQKCEVVSPGDDAVIGLVQDLEYPPPTNPDGPTAVANASGSLSSLTAKMIRIEITEDVGRTTINAKQPVANLAYKVYLDEDSDCAKLDDKHPESERTFESLNAGMTLYVVLANKEHLPEGRIGYTLEVKPAPLP